MIFASGSLEISSLGSKTFSVKKGAQTKTSPDTAAFGPIQLVRRSGCPKVLSE